MKAVELLLDLGLDGRRLKFNATAKSKEWQKEDYPK